jgi:uncharacterized protein
MRTESTRAFLAFFIRHAKLVIACTAVLTVGFAFLAVRVEIKPQIENLIPEDDLVMRQLERYGLDKFDYLIVTVTADDPFFKEGLAAFQRAIVEIEAIPGIRTGVNPFRQITFERSGRRLRIIPMIEVEPQEMDREAVGKFKERLLSDPFSEHLVVSEDGRTLAALFPYEELDSFAVITRIHEIMTELESLYQVHITGMLPFEEMSRQYLLRDIPILFSLCALLIVIMYYLGFRSFRAVMLPITVVMIGAVWTVGLMMIVGFPITVVSIMTPSMVLTLGSSYSIHILNEYFRKSRPGMVDTSWIAESVSHVTRTIVLASLTTVVGFASLLITQVSQTRQFAVSTSFGILSCALLSLTFLPAALSLWRPPKEKQKERTVSGATAKALERLAAVVIRYKWVFSGSILVIAAGFLLSMGHISRNADYLNYFSDDDYAVRDLRFIFRQIGGIDQFYIILESEQEGFFIEPENLHTALELEDDLLNGPNISYSTSFPRYVRELNHILNDEREIPGSKGLILLLSRYFSNLANLKEGSDIIDFMADEDFSRIIIAFRTVNGETGMNLIDSEIAAFIESITRQAESYFGDRVELTVTGARLKYLSLFEGIVDDQRNTMLMAIGIIFLVSTIAFKSFSFGFLSLVPMLTGVMVNFIGMAVFQFPLDITTVMVSSVAIGIGVDDSMHFLIQLKRQLGRTSGDLEMAVANTLIKTGRPIVLTSVSIIAGLMAFLFASFLPVMYFGILVSITLFFTTIGCLVLLPAVVAVFRGFGKRGAGR